MNKEFEIIPFRSQKFKQILSEIVSEYEGNRTPLVTILNYLYNPPLNCETAVFEREYIDKDYLDEYSNFYCKAFKKYSNRCVRIHFFSSEIPEDTDVEFHKYKDFYLGFIVLRPTDLQRVGRTILIPPVKDENLEFINCTTKSRAHIYGESFYANAMPFIQQDTQVGACAQATLWMAARYMSHKYGDREYYPGEINRLAKTSETMGRSLPAERGLTVSQMLNALNLMGFCALFYHRYNIDDLPSRVEQVFPVDPNARGKEKEDQLNIQRSAKLAEITYRYIESCLPTILNTLSHSIIAIGHKYDHTAQPEISLLRIPSFYIHNDAKGPYLEFPWRQQFLNIYSIIALLPREVTLSGEQAEDMAVTCLEELLQARPIDKDGNESGEDIKTIICYLRPEFEILLSKLEYRTYLMNSMEFKRELKNRALDERIQKYLIHLDLPKYLWITEVSSSALLNKAKKGERMCLGKVIIDSTAPAHTPGTIAIHFCDVLLLRDRQTNRGEVDICKESTPFPHKIWC